MSEQLLPSSLQVGGEAPDRNLTLELVRVTEPGSPVLPAGTVRASHGTTAKVRGGVARVTVKVRKHHRVHVTLTFKGGNYRTTTRSITVRG